MRQRARNVRSGSPSRPALGAILGNSWAVLEASWAVLGRSWAVLGPPWGPLGPIWDDRGATAGTNAIRSLVRYMIPLFRVHEPWWNTMSGASRMSHIGARVRTDMEHLSLRGEMRPGQRAQEPLWYNLRGAIFLYIGSVDERLISLAPTSSCDNEKTQPASPRTVGRRSAVDRITRTCEYQLTRLGKAPKLSRKGQFIA